VEGSCREGAGVVPVTEGLELALQLLLMGFVLVNIGQHFLQLLPEGGLRHPYMLAACCWMGAQSKGTLPSGSPCATGGKLTQPQTGPHSPPGREHGRSVCRGAATNEHSEHSAAPHRGFCAAGSVSPTSERPGIRPFTPSGMRNSSAQEVGSLPSIYRRIMNCYVACEPGA
jgi:hypothetical protein